jgi:hypothetical protein
VLEPAVCALGVGWNRSAWPGSGAGIKNLGELQHFRADRQTQQLEACAGKTHQVAIGTAVDNLGCSGALKAKALGEEAGIGFPIPCGEANAVEMLANTMLYTNTTNMTNVSLSLVLYHFVITSLL